MSRRGRWSLVVLCVALVAIGLVQPDERRRLSSTTFGTAPYGFRALFETLLALDVPAERSFAATPDLPAGATVWWIEPREVCASAAIGPPTADEAGTAEDGQEWIAAGGTAVLIAAREQPCPAVFGIALPSRVVPEEREVRVNGAQFVDDTPSTPQVLRGRLAASPRTLDAPPMATFTDAGGMEVVEDLDGRPFALAQSVGQGRLVVVADARFLRNQWLDHADNAVAAFDLIRSYGPARFDERAHGLRRETHPLRYVLHSAALPVLLGLAVLAALAVWRGQLLPPYTAASAPPRAPTLVIFVESLARLYAGTGDYGRVLERYRQLTAARLRRHFGLPPETPLPTLVDRLRAGRRAADAELDRLSDAVPVASARELAAAVRALDALVREAAR